MEGKKINKKLINTIIICSIFIVSIAAVGVISYLTGVNLGESKKTEDINFISEFIVAFVAIYASLYIHIIIHEGGHLVFGLLTGYKFESFRVGSIVLVSTKDGMRLRRFHLLGTAGQCLLSPPDMKNESCPYILYNLGGIIANIITSLIGIIILMLINVGPHVHTFIAEFIVIGFVIALLNGIPLRMGGINNDGHNVLSLGKNKTAIKSFWIQLKVNGLITKGIRVKDMDEELFVIPDKDDLENALCAEIGVLACTRNIDNMNFKGAKEIAEYMIENVKNLVLIHKYMLISEIIFCELVGNNNKEYINKFHTKEFNKFLKSSKKYLPILRMKYAYSLLFNQDEEEAKKYLKSFEKLAKNYIHQSELEGERELIEYVNKLYYK